MDNKKERNYITFEKKQIASIMNHHNKNVIDLKTNKVMMMYAIKLPSKNYRHFRFGKDSQGIDRDSRSATISIGAPYIYQNKENPDLYYTYLDQNREFMVYFKGHILGKDENHKSIFDQPEPFKISGKELIQIFREAKEISKKRNAELKKKREQDIKNKSKKKTDIKKDVPVK